ncbi:chaplin ChpH [Streptomyces pilosus]|uniref:chaplin ChpH n=1 Tax=Streptomyces pilosus TaxID=28893 RepID=UPI00359A7E99
MLKKVVAVAAATGGLVLAGAGMAAADSGAQGAAVHSPGVLSGNVIQAPIHIPVNVCGNTISVIGLLNPTFGNTCINA